MTHCAFCGILERIGGPFRDDVCWRCVRERERGANMKRDVDTTVGRPKVPLVRNG